jgi:hypothetical protein
MNERPLSCHKILKFAHRIFGSDAPAARDSQLEHEA